MGAIRFEKNKQSQRMMHYCLLALGILVFLALADFILLNRHIQTTRFDSTWITLSSKQRILFERASLLARYFISAPDNAEKERSRENLLLTIEELEQSMEAILHGDKRLGVPERPPEVVEEIYSKRPHYLEERMRNYILALKAIAYSRNDEISASDSRLRQIRMISSGKILGILDEVSLLFKKVSDEKTRGNMALIAWITLTTLFVIAGIWFLIFLPMIREEKKKLGQLETMNLVLEDTNSRLEKLAMMDALTNTLNRRGLQQMLSREISRAAREGWTTHALLIDLDQFKTINDTMGYATGDIVIMETARRLERAVRTTDYVARIGGDEFMILLPKTNRAEALAVAHKVRVSVSESVIQLAQGKSPQVTASIGMAPVNGDTVSLDDLLEKIYPALKSSKLSGKNRVTSYDEDHPRDDLSPDTVAQKLRGIDVIYAVKQPIIDIISRQVVAFEMLSRSQIPSYESPAIFFRVALENDMLTLVDHNCFKVCGEASENCVGGMQWHYNLFPSTLLNVPIDQLLDALPKNNGTGRYCIEISEEQIIGEPSYLLNQITALKQAGVLIAIDDVGFGRSCLENLILLEPNIIKIDKKCIQGLSHNDARVRSLKRLLNVINTLKAEVIAEGVEEQSDLEVLKNLGVRYAQGYLFGMPV